MNSAFSSAAENLYGVRHYGSSIKTLAAEPYTTGTFYVWFGGVSEFIEPYLGATSQIVAAEIPQILSAFCTGVTPPGGTLNTVEYTGIGGVKWGVPGSIEYGRTISLKFMEMQSTPILDIMSAWVRMIRDNRTGVSNLRADTYKQSNYSGTLLYWTTDPSGQSVQYYAAYDGIFPLKDPSDLFSSDVETVDKQEIEVEFNVNRIFKEDWVYELCDNKNDAVVANHKNLANNFNNNFG